MLLPVTVVILTLCLSSFCCAQEEENGLLKIGGFRCIDLKPLRNDASYDLYETGYFCYASFRMDVWKRHGVPFLYQRETGDIRVAGPGWSEPAQPVITAANAGARASANAQQPGNGAIEFANDGVESTYWYSGDDHPTGKLWIEFAAVSQVNAIRFLGWAAPRHAPKDYSVGLILPDGAWKEVASVRDEKRMGEWISFPVEKAQAKGIYIDVRATGEGQHGPVIYELQALGKITAAGGKRPSEVVVPLHGVAAEELFCLGHVGEGFDTNPDVETPVGEYVLHYRNGETETVPLIAGKNVADLHYGRQFVPEAEFAFGFKDTTSPPPGEDGALYYHLGEMLPVPPRRQLLMFGHALDHPHEPLESLTFRVTDPKAMLVLAGLTLRQSGPRMNALVYNGKMVLPYPKDTPKAKPSPVDAMKDRSRIISLDGEWRYATDPGNRGIRHKWFADGHDASGWKTMPVPSQWYVQGLDYHGVVWFRREVKVPASFPGSVMQLSFGGVDYDARVWVNGEYAGRHTGAFASFKFDATKTLRKGATNLVVVRVDSPIDPGYSSQKTIIKGNSQDDICMPYNEEGCSGGIFRSVAIESRGDVGIENAWAVSTLSDDLKHADVKVKFDLIGRTNEPVRVKCWLTEPGKPGGPGSQISPQRRVFEAHKTVTPAGTTPVELDLSIDNPMLWYPWEQGPPNLHIMEIEVRRGHELLDRHISRVGIREVRLNDKKHCVYVNHHRIFIKGMLNDDIHWMSMMDRTGYRQRIQLQKDANLNLIRMVGHQSSPDMYDLCDEMGMMIWQEMPLQWGYSQAEPVREDILDVVRETTLQTRPHASVIGWSAWNEGGQPGFSEKITNTIHDLDGTRPMTKACGFGDFDIHIYPNITPAQMSRRTFFWSGLKLGFVSEVGAYGLSSLDEMREMVGDDLFKFDSAEYFWETLNSYRYNDGPVFWDSPFNGYWPIEKVKDYVLNKIEPSERWLVQFMKFMYENFRAQRFDPTTAAIHCRFDDALPTAYLGVVNFNGRPRKAYYSVKEACQQVLPIVFFDYTGAEDVRVVNEYWNRSWQGCKLSYVVKDRLGNVVTKLEKAFDLPADSTVKVLTREEAGDLYHVAGGFFAELTVADSTGKVLSKNHYDLTAQEVEAFVTSVYPVPPVAPIDSVLLKTDAAAAVGVPQRIEGDGTYSRTLLQLGARGQDPLGRDSEPHPNAEECYLRYDLTLPEDGNYLVRAACDSGVNLRAYQCSIDGKPLELESYPYTQMDLGMTRLPYSSHNLSWRPGWRTQLAKGGHVLEIKWVGDGSAPTLTLDAICLQHCVNPNTVGYEPAYHADQSTTDNKNLK